MKLQSNKISFKGQNIYVGIDVHLKTWSVTILLKDSNYKKTFTQPASPEGTLRALEEELPRRYLPRCLRVRIQRLLKLLRAS